ncbi:MAG: protein kinase [Planctomycetes bacterium]|nr:protein kinase [Planctomycetota bacterium]
MGVGAHDPRLASPAAPPAPPAPAVLSSDGPAAPPPPPSPITGNALDATISDVPGAPRLDHTRVAASMAVPTAGKPAQLGPYLLFKVIGSGGMGVVYEAQHEKLPRKVALKCLPTSHSHDPSSVERFQREARIASQLNPPNLCPVFDVGVAGTTQYFAMEYLIGKNLEELTDQGLLTCEEAAAAVRDVAAGLHYAHQQGVLHRDLKPSNIIRTENGRVVLTDFGLALESSLPVLTQSGAVVGTAAYMSPEQASGERKSLNACSEVYGLGATLYFMLTKRTPFQGGSFEAVIAQVLFNDPPPPRSIAPAIPRDLETIVLKAMEKEPNRRYPSAEALAQDLDRFIAGESIVARPSTKVEIWVRRARRHPRVAAGAAAAALVLSVVGYFVAGEVRAANQRAEEQRLETERLEADRRRQEAEQRKKDAEEKARLEAEKEALTWASQAQMMKAQNHAAAVELLDKALARAPHLPALRLARGRLYREVGQYKKAIDDFTAVIEADAQSIEGYAERGVTYYLMGDNLHVVGELAAVLRLAPEHPFADIGRGCASYMQGKRADAIKWWDKSIGKDGGNAMAYALRGAALIELGERVEDGRADIEKALELDPQNVTALTARALDRVLQGRFAEAQSDADGALRIFPGNGWAASVRGWARVHLGQYAEAIPDLERAIRLRGIHLEAMFALAECYYVSGRVADAERTVEQALARRPDERSGRFLRGMARADLKKLDGAQEDLAAVEAGGVVDPQVVILRSTVLYRRGDGVAAHRALGPMEGKGGRMLLFYVAHGRALVAEKKNLQEAAREFATAQSLFPGVKELIKEELAALAGK